MSPKRRPNEAWKFWQRSQAALDELTGAMQTIATFAAAEPAIAFPPHLVKKARHAIDRFQENFSLLVREQKRKAVR